MGSVRYDSAKRLQGLICVDTTLAHFCRGGSVRYDLGKTCPTAVKEIQDLDKIKIVVCAMCKHERKPYFRSFHGKHRTFPLRFVRYNSFARFDLGDTALAHFVYGRWGLCDTTLHNICRVR